MNIIRPISSLKKTAAHRKPGYLDACLKTGKITGEGDGTLVEFTPEQHARLRKEFSLLAGDWVHSHAGPIGQKINWPCMERDAAGAVTTNLKPRSLCGYVRQSFNITHSIMKKLFLCVLCVLCGYSVFAGTNAAVMMNSNTWQIVFPNFWPSNATAIANALNGIGFTGSGAASTFYPAEFYSNISGQVQLLSIPSNLLNGNIPLSNLWPSLATLESNNAVNLTNIPKVSDATNADIATLATNSQTTQLASNSLTTLSASNLISGVIGTNLATTNGSFGFGVNGNASISNLNITSNITGPNGSSLTLDENNGGSSPNDVVVSNGFSGGCVAILGSLGSVVLSPSHTGSIYLGYNTAGVSSFGSSLIGTNSTVIIGSAGKATGGGFIYNQLNGAQAAFFGNTNGNSSFQETLDVLPWSFTNWFPNDLFVFSANSNLANTRIRFDGSILTPGVFDDFTNISSQTSFTANYWDTRIIDNPAAASGNVSIQFYGLGNFAYALPNSGAPVSWTAGNAGVAGGSFSMDLAATAKHIVDNVGSNTAHTVAISLADGTQFTNIGTSTLMLPNQWSVELTTDGTNMLPHFTPMTLSPTFWNLTALTNMATSNLLATGGIIASNIIAGAQTFAGQITTIAGTLNTLASGNNAGITLGTNSIYIISSGPTAAFAINGIAGGAEGREVTLANWLPYTMTIANNSGVDPVPANRIATGQGADLALSNCPAYVKLRYTAVSNVWQVVNFNSSAGVVSSSGGIPTLNGAGTNTYLTNATSSGETLTNALLTNSAANYYAGTNGPVGNGGGLTNLNASNIASGTLSSNSMQTNFTQLAQHWSGTPIITCTTSGTQPIYTGGTVTLHNGNDMGGHITITNGTSTGATTSGLIVLNITPQYPFSTNVSVHLQQACYGQWGESTAYRDMSIAYWVSNNISASGLVTNFSIIQNQFVGALGGLATSTAYGLEWSVSGP